MPLDPLGPGSLDVDGTPSTGPRVVDVFVFAPAACPVGRLSYSLQARAVATTRTSAVATVSRTVRLFPISSHLPCSHCISFIPLRRDALLIPNQPSRSPRWLLMPFCTTTQ